MLWHDVTNKMLMLHSIIIFNECSNSLKTTFLMCLLLIRISQSVLGQMKIQWNWLMYYHFNHLFWPLWAGDLIGQAQICNKYSNKDRYLMNRWLPLRGDYIYIVFHISIWRGSCNVKLHNTCVIDLITKRETLIKYFEFEFEFVLSGSTVHIKFT